MKIAIGNDHGGLELKNHIIGILEERKIDYHNFGTDTADSVDYPDYAVKVARSILEGDCDRGILLCGTGLGIDITANRFKGIRAALCHDGYTARMSRSHNNANVLVMGGRTTGPGVAEEILDIWLETPFEGGRHQRRVDKIDALTR